jgi:TDG/mug DNA glycosylase family protein
MLRDVLDHNLTVVFCGTAVGTKSAERAAYYAGPGNKFWRTIHRIGLTPRHLRPEEFKSLPQFGVGLTDLVKVKSGADSDLKAGHFDVPALEEKIRKHAPRILCFNGKKAAQVFLKTKSVNYGVVESPFDQTTLFVAPSTSGAANGFWDESFWFTLAQLCKYD